MRQIYGTEPLVDRMIELLEQGVVGWRKPWNKQLGRPRNLLTRKCYQGCNAVYLNTASFPYPFWVTEKQAIKLNGNVRKCETPWSVFSFFQSYTKAPSGERVVEPESMIRAVTHKVYNVAQCEGLEKVVEKLIPNLAKIMEPIKSAEKVLQSMPNPPRFKTEKQQAFYQPKQDCITMPMRSCFASNSHYYSTLFHELVHASGHETRLRRSGIVKYNKFGSHDYSFEELVAEAGAAMLCNECGIDDVPLENSAAYLQGWLKVLKNDRHMLLAAIFTAQQAVKYLLQGIKPMT